MKFKLSLKEKLRNFGSRHFKSEQYNEEYFIETCRLGGPPVSQLYVKLLFPIFLKHANLMLDAGCGRFEAGKLLEEYGKDVIGIDISPTVKTSKQIRGSIAYMPLRDAIFDSIVAFEVIEHLTCNEAKYFFRESHRILKKNGILILSTPHWFTRLRQWIFGITDRTHKVYYNPSSIIKSLKQSGFNDIKVTSFTELKLHLRIFVQKTSILTWLGLGMIVFCKKR